MITSKTVMIIAGEASGDMHGASLVQEMLKIDPNLNFFGIGGNKMAESGVKLLANVAETAVVGLTEVVSKLFGFIKIIRNLTKSLDNLKPDLVILIDYPDFNLNIVARAAKKRNIKIFYYISPQVWAWRQGRINQIKKLVNKMAVILPFEVDLYASRGFRVHYVGHPLLDLVKRNYSKTESRQKFNLAGAKTTIGLLPGSRISEVEKLLPEMLRAAATLEKQIPDIQFVLPLADTLEEKIISEIISRLGIKINVIRGNTYDVISCADLAIVASGTATLETALLGIPMIIVYKISPLSYFIGKLVISVQNIGLVNIIAGKTIVPELIQGEASGERIAREALAILTNDEKKRQIIKELNSIRAKLGNPGAAIRAAKLACDML
ncbi:MAG: lipid-A-disaccharide synthase [Deltaproteobacteria bacterium HGW-Deltaproteobacteria-12]|nr:MAG: lipid-A-disaccharide synthase [Deltaproteobacteria bacterium HGW-Deltaproteobacteria-12]